MNIVTEPTTITETELASFVADGYLIKRNLLSTEEAAALLQACTDDVELRRRVRGLSDGQGGATEIALWNRPGNDVLGALARGERLVRGSERLLGGEVYHYHSKLNEKRPGAGGTWVWHQDYGYWYQNGCLLPDMLTAAVPLVPIDTANGCLRVLRGSHRMGRIEHLTIGEQTGADPQRVEWAKDRFDEVSFEAEPGDVMFFHCNTLHTSSPNLSDRLRSLLLIAYNTRANNPLVEHHHPRYEPIEVLADSELMARANLRDGANRVFLDGRTDLSADTFATYG